jgi:hypothetical protein
MSEKISDETAAAGKRHGGAHLKINISGVRTIEQDHGGVTRSDEGGADLDDETCRCIALSVEGKGAGRACGRVIMIDAGEKRETSEVRSAEIVGGQEREGCKFVVSGGEFGMSLCRDSIAGMECSVGDDAGRESRDGGAGTYADAARNLAGAAVSYGGSAEHGEVFRRPERLTLELRRENQCG